MCVQCASSDRMQNVLTRPKLFIATYHFWIMTAAQQTASRRTGDSTAHPHNCCCHINNQLHNWVHSVAQPCLCLYAFNLFTLDTASHSHTHTIIHTCTHRRATRTQRAYSGCGHVALWHELKIYDDIGSVLIHCLR